MIEAKNVKILIVAKSMFQLSILFLFFASIPNGAVESNGNFSEFEKTTQKCLSYCYIDYIECTYFGLSKKKIG